MTLTTKLIAKLTADAEYYWDEYHAARRDGLEGWAERMLAAYNRRMAAVKYLKGR